MKGDSRLKIFAVLAEAGSFTLAAKRLGVSQPAVSQSIASLEKTYGCALLSRTSSGFSLSREGRIVYDYAKRIMALYAELDDALEGRPASGAAVLDLGDGRTAEVSVRDGKIEIGLK